jgi:hypothetical protein
MLLLSDALVPRRQMVTTSTTRDVVMTSAQEGQGHGDHIPLDLHVGMRPRSAPGYNQR